MIRGLRRRFILGAMAAFAIFFILLLAGIGVASWHGTEATAQRMMETALDMQPELRPSMEAARDFARRRTQIENLGSHYLIEIAPDGSVQSIEERGIWDPDEELAKEYALQILQSGRESGKLQEYKYLLRKSADGSARLVLLDFSMQTRMLRSMLGVAGLACLFCLAALFLILLPVSKRVVQSYAANVEKQKQFITNAGHEIKTPVAIIMSNVDAMELLQGENKWSRNIRGQTERLNALLQRLLFLARTGEGSVNLPESQVELGALLGAELEAYDEIIAEKGLKLEKELPEITLRGSREYLQQLAHALLDNAVQYANPGGSISIHMEKRRGRARIQLYNSVSTLPDCPPEALFERFYRGDGARTQSGGGYGIGLSAAKAIAEMHRGRIGAEYVGTDGVRFTVELPAKGALPLWKPRSGE